MRDGHRQPPGRFGVSEQNVGNRMTALHSRVPRKQYRGDVGVPRVEHDRAAADHHHHGASVDFGHRLDQGDILGVQPEIATVAAEVLELAHGGRDLDQDRGDRPEPGDAAEQLRRCGVHPDQRLALVHRRQPHHDYGCIGASRRRHSRHRIRAADMNQLGPQPFPQPVEDGDRRRGAHP